MIKVRRLLTEVLLEVTTEEMQAAAEDTFIRARSKGIAKLNSPIFKKAGNNFMTYLFLPNYTFLESSKMKIVGIILISCAIHFTLDTSD